MTTHYAILLIIIHWFDRLTIATNPAAIDISKDRKIPLRGCYRPPWGGSRLAGATISWINGFSANNPTFAYSGGQQPISASGGQLAGCRALVIGSSDPMTGWRGGQRWPLCPCDPRQYSICRFLLHSGCCPSDDPVTGITIRLP